MSRDAAACLLCEGADPECVFEYREPDAYERALGVAAAGYHRAWLRCKGCGFHYAHSTRSAAEIDRIYDDTYRSRESGLRSSDAETTFKRMVELPLEQSESLQRAEYLRHALQRLDVQELVRIPGHRPLRLLDVGGASGVFAYVFGAVFPESSDRLRAPLRPGLFGLGDWTLEVIDPSRQGRFLEAHGVRYHQARFSSDAFDPVPGSGEPSCAAPGFDLITMNYLLEHVPDPLRVLRTAHLQLRTDGLVYIEVPDAIAFDKLAPDDDIFNSCHLWMFDPHSLMRVLELTHFDALELRRGRSPRGHYFTSALARPRR